MIFSKQAILISILWIINLSVFFLYLWPAYPALQKSYLMSQQTAEELNKEKDFSSKLDAILADEGDVKDKIKIAGSALPVGKNIPELITQVTALVSDNGLALTNINISNAININDKPYKTLGVAITTTGNYDSFKLFIKAVENNLRIIDISSISFASPQKSEDPMEFKLSFQTYYQ